MKEDTCLYTGGASKRGRAAPSRSQRFLREVLTCVGTLLALYGAAPVHALSGFPDSGQIGFFSDPAAPNDAKFYCDWRFDSVISPLIPACAQHDAGLVAVQVGAEGFNLDLESDVTISFTTSGVISTSTKDVGAARVALICETAGGTPVTGKEHCLRITEGGGGGPAACPAKFANITTDAAECTTDLAKLRKVFGPTAHIDFTKDRNNNGTLNVNICTPASWVCADPPSSLTGLGNREIQQLGSALVDTPITCKIGGTNHRYPTPPVSQCP